MKSKNPKIQILNKTLAILLLMVVLFSTLFTTLISNAEEGNNTVHNSGESDPSTGGNSVLPNGGESDPSTDGNDYVEDWAGVINGEESEYESVKIDSEDLKKQLEKYGLTNYETFFKEIKENNIVEISNEGQLRALVLYVAEGGVTEGKTFRLTKNIGLSSDEWTPIGNNENPFKGTFDGAGYTISNIVITIKQSYAGLFGYIKDATIKNLNIGNSKINMNLNITDKYLSDVREKRNVFYSYLGAVVGYASDSTISNCKNKADVFGGQAVGGIAGGVSTTDILDCSNSGTVYGLKNIGGIVGSADGNNNKYIEKCKNSGNIMGIFGDTGGIAGLVYRFITVKKCYNSGSVSSAEEIVTYYIANGTKDTYTAQNVGGIVGWASGSDDWKKADNAITINACINDEGAIIKGYQDVGGIVGQLAGVTGGQAFVDKCISYSNDVSAIIKYSAGMIAGNIGVYQVKKDANGKIETTEEGKTKYNIISVGHIKNCHYIISEKETDLTNTNHSTINITSSNQKNIVRGYGFASRVNSDESADNKIDSQSTMYKITKNNNKYLYLDNTKLDLTADRKITNDYRDICYLLNTDGFGNGYEGNETNGWTITDKNKFIDDNGKIYIDKNAPIITDVKLKLSDGTEVKDNRLVKKDDVITIEITFDEKINIGDSSEPVLKVIKNTNYKANFVCLDENKLYFSYTVIGDENSTLGNNMYLSGNIKDTFGNRVTGIDANLKEGKIIVLKNNEGDILLTSANGLISYTLKNFVKGSDGNFYYNSNNSRANNKPIYITAEFTGKAPNDLNNIPSLVIVFEDEKGKKYIGTNTTGASITSGNDNTSKKYKLIYQIDASELKSDGINIRRIMSIGLNTDFKISINETDGSKVIIDEKKLGLTQNNETVQTMVNVSKLYVDTTLPTIKTITAKAIYPKPNNKYTAQEEIEISLTTSELLDLKSSGHIPSVSVKFGNVIGSFNKGKAEFVEAVKNEDDTYTCKYKYVIQTGDEGVLNISCEGNLVDFAGNATTLDVNKDISTIQADTTSPTVAITAKKVVDENNEIDITNNITNAEVLEYTFDWSEEVNDFAVEYITINGGKVKEDTTLTQDSTDKTKYTLQVEPSVSNGNVGEIEVIVEAGRCKDNVNLENIRTENKITIDKKAPNLINYEVSKTDSEIRIKAIFDEAIGTAHTTDIEIKFGENNANGTISEAAIDVNDKSIVNYLYNISGADEGIPTITLKQNTLEDIAGNKNNIDVIFENNIKLEKHVLKVNNNEYSFEYKKGEEAYKAILDFNKPTYLKAGDKIKVKVNAESYEYTVKTGDNNGHMQKMNITQVQGTTKKTVTFSQNGNGEDISSVNIYFDTIAPTVTLTANVEEPSENNIYAKGKEIIIVAKTSEDIQNKDNIPEVKISFSQSGIGKYNYQGEETTRGNAKYIETIENSDKTVSWKYKYIVTEGDEGEIILDYANDLTISDLAGNETSLTGYPSAPTASLKTEDLTDNTISGKETKVTYEFYKGNSKITDFTQNTYYKKGETIKVVVKFSNELYSSYGSSNIGIDKDTAPQLKINDKVFDTESVNSKKEITYTYTVNNDENVKLTNLQLTYNKSLYAKKSNNTYETISRNNGLDISNANLYIYNNSTEFENSNIKADTISPTVTITAKKDGETSNISNNITNATKLIYTFTWSEEVVGFTAEDITVNNGTKGTLSTATKNQNGTYSYTMEITPNVENGNEGQIQVIVEQNACQDLVGQSNIRTESIIRVDKKSPMLISLEAYSESNVKLDSNVDTVKQYYKVGDKVTVIATFSENVSESEKTKLALEFSESGNAKGTVSEATIDGNKLKYTYTITEKDNGTLLVKGFSGKVADSAGNITQVTKRTLDGDTIIADTIAPTLRELKVVSPAENVYKADQEITIEAIYDEEIYAIENNVIKNIDSSNAPELKLKFGSGSEKTATVNGYGETAGKKDMTKIRYTYTIVDGDNGNLVITSYVNKQNNQVCDIAGNVVVTLDKNQTGNTITADTIRPTVKNVTAVVENPTIGNTGIYHKAGNKIKITVTFSEIVKPEVSQPKIQVGFSENENKEPTTYKDKSYESDLNADSKTVEYTYDIEDGDNGYLWIKVPENQFKDLAGNMNIEKEKTQLKTIFADTTNPYLATNSDGNAQWKIETIKNSEGQVTGIKAVGIFNEKIFSMNDNGLTSLSDIPVLGVFVNGELKDTATNPSITVENEKTKLTYQINATRIDTTEKISANFINGTVYDRAGNKMSIEITDGDITSPIFQDIKVVTPNGFYKADEKIEIIARFKEETKIVITPTLNIRVGNKEIPLTGTYNAEDTENTDTIKVVRYTYPIVGGDNGALNIISLKGYVSDGVRTSKEISKIYIDLTDDNVNDVNAEARTLLNSEETAYANNDKEYENVIADTIKPYITKVEAKANDEVIASYTKEDGKDASTTVGKTNANEIEYVITFSELVNYKAGMQVYNGTIKDITNNDTNKDGYYDQVIIKVQPTIEGVQSLMVPYNTFEDRAGNENNAERFNLVTTDFTKPTIRFISEYNGGTYVMPTNIGKVEIRPNVEISEDIAKIEYKWDNEDYAEINNYSTSSDIAVPTKTFTEADTYILSIRATDLAGNVSESSKTYIVVNSNINITLDKTEWTNQDITVTVKFGEGLTDNRKVTFKSETTGETVQLNAIGTDTDGNPQYLITENGTIYADATDRVGNKVFTERTITKIDKETPKVTIDLNGANLVIGTCKTTATIKTNVEVKDNKALDYAKFAYIQKDIDITNISDEDKALIVTNLNSEAKIENAISTKGKTPYYLYVLAKDQAGNETIEKAGPFTVLDTNEREIAIEKLIAFTQKGKHIDIIYNNFGDNEEYLNIIREKEITLSNDEDGFIDYENYSYVDVNKPTTITVVGKDICGNEVRATHEVTKESIDGPEFEVYGNPEVWTSQDIKLEVYCDEELSALTVNGNDILANMYIIVTKNGNYKFIATDVYGMTSEKTIQVTKIDKDNPVISKAETSGKTITITAEDATSGVERYAITDTTELPVEWSDSNVIKVTHDGEFYAWAMDKAGNYVRTDESITVDTTAPTITFRYNTTTVTLGESIGATILTNEDAKISYSWDNKNWTTSEEYITATNAVQSPTKVGTYTLYVKATDKYNNTSNVEKLQFSVIKAIEKVEEPEIIFEDLPVIQVDGIKYVKVSADMTSESVIAKMNKTALNNKTPEFTNLIKENKLKTGSEIKLNGKTKYIVIVNGDVNCDGKIDFLGDIITANNYRIGIQTLSTMQKLAADIDNDGKVEFISDILSMNNYRIGITNSL